MDWRNFSNDIVTNYEFVRTYEQQPSLTMKSQLNRNDLVYPELSYEIVGCAYEVFDGLGSGHSEKTYQRAFAVALKKKEIPFEEQVYYSVKFKDEIVGKGFLDFEVDSKVIVELKKNVVFSKAHLEQVLDYLRMSNLKLGILITFSNDGVRFKRIININQPVS